MSKSKHIKIDQMSQILSDFIRDRDFFYRKDFTDMYKLDESTSSIANLVTRVLAKFVKKGKLIVSDRKSNSLQYMVLQIKNMKTNLKENIWIEGFDTEKHKDSILDTWYKENELLWHGKTFEIPEKLANEVLKIDEELSYWDDVRDIVYIDYQGHTSTSCFRTAIQSACDKPYCIIYKTE